MSLSVFDMPAFDLDALIVRAQADELADELTDELTDADRELIIGLSPHIEELMQATISAFFGILMPGFEDVFATFPSLASLGGKTYRTEPIPGAELGGIPRNPESDVIDEIDRIVEWQLKGGEGW